MSIHMIYAGGTVGCHGSPLSALPSQDFLPALFDLLNNLSLTSAIEEAPNTVIKDSSTLDSHDFLHFYQLIIKAYQQGASRFLILTGTDTLSYLAAFLTIALADKHVCVVLTGSMQPLFDPNKLPLTLQASDAWDNIQTAIKAVKEHNTGCYVAFAKQIWHGDSTQKIHKNTNDAFVGISSQTPLPCLPSFNKAPIVDRADLYGVLCLPNEPKVLSDYLQTLLHHTPTAILIHGFGAGNMPHSLALEQALTHLSDAGFLLIMTASVPFGTVAPEYAAGAWQYRHGVLSGKALPTPTLYGYALWLCLCLPVSERRKAWLEVVACR